MDRLPIKQESDIDDSRMILDIKKMYNNVIRIYLILYCIVTIHIVTFFLLKWNC